MYSDELRLSDETIIDKLSALSVDERTMFIIVMLMDTVEKAKMLMSWIEQNPCATSGQIFAKAIMLSPQTEPVSIS